MIDNKERGQAYYEGRENGKWECFFDLEYLLKEFIHCGNLPSDAYLELEWGNLSKGVKKFMELLCALKRKGAEEFSKHQQKAMNSAMEALEQCYNK